MDELVFPYRRMSSVLAEDPGEVACATSEILDLVRFLSPPTNPEEKPRRRAGDDFPGDILGRLGSSLRTNRDNILYKKFLWVYLPACAQLTAKKIGVFALSTRWSVNIIA
jgi:hypothetical protein